MVLLILLSIFVVTIIFVSNKEITSKEYLLTVLYSTLAVVLVYSISLIPFDNDTYFQSGRITKTQFHPAWIEEYQQAHTMCVSTGKTTSCTTYYTTEHDHHKPYWTVSDSLGQEWKVSSKFHAQVKSYFGNNKVTTRPNKATHGGHFDGGDPYLYTYNNDTNIYKYPTSKIVKWYNPIKDSDSVFNAKTIYKKDYPKVLDMNRTNRLLTNLGSEINGHDWDILNTKAYSLKKVNLIAVQVKSMSEASQLEKSWINGRKNDLVICVVGKYTSPDNVKVFGWTESAKVKIELQHLILEHGLVKSQFSKMLQIINRDYKDKDFTKFSYLERKPPLWALIVSAILSALVSFFCISEFSNNSEDRY